MTQLTREQAVGVLATTGFPSGTFRTNMGLTVPFPTLMVGIGSAESDLTVEAQGPPNRDGTVDRGWLQINSAHGYDPDLLTSDAAYTATAALQILLQQGVRAWAAYAVRNAEGVFPYSRHMPPGGGGPDLFIGSTARRNIVVSWQQFLIGAGGDLVADGSYGPRTEAATVKWKSTNHNDGSRNVNVGTWRRARLL